MDTAVTSVAVHPDVHPNWMAGRSVSFIGFGDVVRSRGARVYLASFVAAMQRAGARVDAVFYQQDLGSAENPAMESFSIVRPPKVRAISLVPAVFRRLWETAWTLWHASRMIRGLDPETAVFVTGAPLLVLTPLLRRRRGPRFYVMHGIAEESLLVPSRRARLRYRAAKLLERMFLRHFTSVVVVSRAMAQYCTREYGISRFVLAPCGIDPTSFRRSSSQRDRIRSSLGVDGRPVFVYSGSADISHCAPQTVEAFAVARRVIPDAFLLVLSYEPDVFESLLRESGETDWRVLSVAPEEVPAYLSAGDAACLLLVNRPTIWVSCPVKFAEYMASGLPVIAPPFVGDYSEVIRRERIGVMLDPDDRSTWEPAFTELKTMIGDPNVRRRCLQVAESLSWDQLPTRFSQIAEAISPTIRRRSGLQTTNVVRRALWGILRRYIPRYRRRSHVRRFANFARNLYLCYENYNYDPATNGEYDILRKITRLSPRAVVFDVGAHVGDWALDAARILQTGHVHCFEVAGPLVERLRAKTADEPRIQVNSFGLSDHETDVDITFYPEATMFTSMFKYPHDAKPARARGRVRKGDDYVREQGIERVSYLKIDVEGSEHFVLKGFEQSLRMRKIDAVQFEYGRVNILANFLLRDFYAFFKQHGFSVGKIYPGYVEFRDYELEHEDFVGPNFLAVRNERTDWIQLLGR